MLTNLLKTLKSERSSCSISTVEKKQIENNILEKLHNYKISQTLCRSGDVEV